MSSSKTFQLVVVFTFMSSLSTSLMGNEARGKQVFQLCQQCHGTKGEGRKDIAAPSIAGMQEWYVLAQLKKFASGGRGTHHLDEGGIRMRPMSKTLKEKDWEYVAAYVSKLPKQVSKATFEGNILRGKELYVTCTACHGADGRGIRATNAPAIAFMDDWYLLKQLKHFKNGIRGYDPTKDPIGMTMVPMASGLPDEQAMKDVITYARALK